MIAVKVHQIVKWIEVEAHFGVIVAEETSISRVATAVVANSKLGYITANVGTSMAVDTMEEPTVIVFNIKATITFGWIYSLESMATVEAIKLRKLVDS